MMKKLLFLLFLFPLCANAQWLPTSVSFQKPNPIVNSKDSVRYIYPGKLDYSYWYNAEFIRANYVNNSSSVHVASGALTVGPFVSVSAPPSRIYANSFTTAPTTDDLTNSIVIGVGNVSAVNNRLGQIGFVSGDVDFTAPKMVAYIQGVATETYAGNTAVGSKMLFFTGTNGGTTPVQRMQIDNLGNVNISGLSNSLPVKTDASKNLISGAIALAGSDVSGVLTGSNGGTGVSNSGKTITLGSSLTTVGAFASTFTMTGTTSVTFPQSGTLATTTTFAGANPTGTSGTTAVNGVATTFMRSDAAPKIDTTSTGFVTKGGSQQDITSKKIFPGVFGDVPLQLLNRTAATSSSGDPSPYFRFGGYSWETTGATSKPVSFDVYMVPTINKTTPGGRLAFVFRNPSGSLEAFSVDQDGSMYATTFNSATYTSNVLTKFNTGGRIVAATPNTDYAVPATLVDNVITKTADYTITGGDFASGKLNVLDIYVDATAGNVTITMPSASTFAGYTVYITRKDAVVVNTVTINTVTGPNTLTTQYQSRMYKSDTTTWYNH